MASAVERAVDTYIRAWRERDAAVREKLVEECFAEDGRLITRTREIRGRTGLLQEMIRLLGDPELVDIRVTSRIDAVGNTFRYYAVSEFRNGALFGNFDAGQIDANGQISLILAFAGSLGETP